MDRLRRLENHEAKHAWLGTLRDTLYWLLHAVFVLGAAVLYSLLACDDPSSVDDSMIGPTIAFLFLLGLFPMLGCVLAGARPVATASALLRCC